MPWQTHSGRGQQSCFLDTQSHAPVLELGSPDLPARPSPHVRVRQPKRIAAHAGAWWGARRCDCQCSPCKDSPDQDACNGSPSHGVAARRPALSPNPPGTGHAESLCCSGPATARFGNSAGSVFGLVVEGLSAIQAGAKSSLQPNRVSQVQKCACSSSSSSSSFPPPPVCRQVGQSCGSHVSAHVANLLL